MAEGETTNPFETGTFPGGEGETSDKTPILHHREEEGIEMKHKGSLPSLQQKGYEFPSTTKSSTSKEHETSLIDTPSGKLHTSNAELNKEEIERRIKLKFANPNPTKFFQRLMNMIG